jgi:predicted GNAT family acetyltransferase
MRGLHVRAALPKDAATPPVEGPPLSDTPQKPDVQIPKAKIIITREDKPTGGRYVARIEGKPDAEMSFSKAGEKIIIIDHTGVPDELGGMGVGKALVEFMVMDVRARGLKIVPLCPFTNAMLRRHKEWQDILKDPF